MINMPYFSSLANWLAALLGNKLTTTREPSSGGMGIRLKAASTRFTSMAFLKINTRRLSGLNPLLKNRLMIKAIMILARGPASPTQSMSLFGFLNPQ